MMQLSLPWLSKTTPTTASAGAASSTTTTSRRGGSCCGLSRLIRRLKKRSKMLQPSSRQPSFQCRYDPLSYSLNFDRSGSADFVDEDYYKYYAFSSRFVATSTTHDCQRLVAASH
ncbi:hypothetical protein ACS0TY_019419 [Phlomoides rotata]